MRLSPSGRRSVAAGVAIATCALTVSACSSSSGTASTNPTNTTWSSSSATRTIGVIPLVGSASEVLTQSINGLQAGAKALGWKIQLIDPNGDGQKMQSAMATMIASHVDAIITMAVDAPLLGPELAAAKAAGIPVIDVNNGVDPATASQYSAIIAPSETEWGNQLGNYMKANLTPAPVLVEVNAPYTSHHMADVAMDVAQPAGFKLAKTEHTDITNIVASYQAVTREGLQSHPESKYILSPGDFTSGIVVPVLKLLNREDVTILTRYDDEPTMKLMRAGSKIVVVATSLYGPALTTLDQLAAYFKNKTPLHSVDTGYTFKVFTNENISTYPATGYAYSLESELAPFHAKWVSEYGIS
jgi:ABC-type sugar transport system substrate-binding protein